MSGELENGDLVTPTHYIVHDATGKWGRVAATSQESSWAGATAGTPSASDILNYLESDDSTFRKITYANFVTALFASLQSSISGTTAGTPSTNDIFGYVESDDTTSRKITYTNLLAALTTSLGTNFGAASASTPVNADVINFISSNAFKTITLANFIIYMRDALRNDPAYVSGRQYLLDREGVPNTGSNIGTGKTRCFPILIQRPITIDQLGAHVITAGAGGLMRLGLYNHDNTNRRPSTLVCATGNIATDNTYSITASLVDTAGSALGSAAISPGPYWGALRVDNTSVITTGYGAQARYGTHMGAAWSSSSDNLIGGSSVGGRYHEYTTGYSFSGVFGDLSSTAPDTSGFSNNNALLIGRAA